MLMDMVPKQRGRVRGKKEVQVTGLWSILYYYVVYLMENQMGVLANNFCTL